MANGTTTGGAPRFNPWRIAGWSIAVILLILPAVAMRYTNEVDWRLPDFIVMGTLFATIGLGIEFLIRQSRSTAYRVGAVIALVTVFVTIWVNLAVGMIGDDNAYNLLFGGVLVIALIGALFANFRPAGMARVMIAAALGQLLVGAGGLAFVVRDALFSMAFALPWMLAAVLFWKAAREG